MNKKEIAEIKKTLKPDVTAIDIIVNAFVQHTENGLKISKISKKRLLSLDETEVVKYLDIVKQTLGGHLEKNLLNISFPFDECKDGGCQDRLYKLRASGLNDAAMNEEFIKHVAMNYDMVDDLMIQIVHGSYDVPVKTKDNIKNDESDDVYEFIICSVCPMVLEKAAIAYNPESEDFGALKQSRIADKPYSGFLFPAFNDRASDVNQVLFYAKKPEDLHPELITALTGGKLPIPADAQQSIFESILSELPNSKDFENTKNIHGEIRARIDTRHMNEEDTHLTKTDVKAIIDSTVEGISDEDFNSAYEKVMADYEDGSLALENLIDTNKFNIDVPDIQIKIKPDKVANVEQKVVDGRKCFIIPISGNVEVNGMPVSES
jgi:hypothetical protein